MGGSSKGGSSDQSGVYAALASAGAAQQAYNLGEQQLQWTKSVWNQEQPLVNEAEQMQINAAMADAETQRQVQQFAMEQEQLYNQYYKPLEQAYIGQAENWATPANTALVTGQARADVANTVQQGIHTASEQLESFGVKPSDPRYAGLYVGANTMGAAAEAGAGTTAAQNLKLQQLALESGAINTGRGAVNATGQLSNTATTAGQGSAQAGAGAGTTAQQNLSTGSAALTQPVNWFNTGATNMGVFTNAVNAYNQNQLGYAQVGAGELASLGQFAGSALGMFSPFKFAAKGGPIEAFANGGGVPTQDAPTQGIPTGGTPGGAVPVHASPSGGQATDDVPALLTVGEFVMPRDVTSWKGQEYWVKQIDKARQEQQEFKGRQDIGGEPAQGIPQRPTFVSRPQPVMASAAQVPARTASAIMQQPVQQPMQGIPA
jgi:hypothetical protein